jgi:hypothetical protein
MSIASALASPTPRTRSTITRIPLQGNGPNMEPEKTPDKPWDYDLKVDNISEAL